MRTRLLDGLPASGSAGRGVDLLVEHARPHFALGDGDRARPARARRQRGQSLGRRQEAPDLGAAGRMRAVGICEEFGREVATADETREILKVGVWHNSVEETLTNLGLPPNRRDGDNGLLVWDTEKTVAVEGGRFDRGDFRGPEDLRRSRRAGVQSWRAYPRGGAGGATGRGRARVTRMARVEAPRYSGRSRRRGRGKAESCTTCQTHPLEPPSQPARRA